MKCSQAVCKINVRRWEGLFQTKTKKYPQFVSVAQIPSDRALHLMTGPFTDDFYQTIKDKVE